MMTLRNTLRLRYGEIVRYEPRTPVAMLVEATISSKTLDAVSSRANANLRQRFPDWSVMAAQPVELIEAAIKDVTKAKDKARWVSDTLKRIQAVRPDFDLGFLADYSVFAAMAWLQTFDGVGAKVAAAVLNMSTLNMPAFMMDSHVLNVFRRMRFISLKTINAEKGLRQVWPVLQHWDCDALYELHWLVKRLGQEFCRPKYPRCSRCPVRHLCGNY